MTRNPYLEMPDDEETYGPLRRTALVDQLAPDPLPSPRTRTPSRTPAETRDLLNGPGGRTSATDLPAAAVGQNAYSGPTQTDIAEALPAVDTPAPGTGDAAPANRQRGYDLLDAYDDPYQRRGGYGGLEPTRKKISEGLLSSGEPYTMVSGAFGMLDAWLRRRALTAPTDFNLADAREIISQAHQDALGRAIDPAYLDEILRGQGWEQGDRYVGQDQLAYVLDQFAQHGAAERAARGPETATPETGAPATPAGDLGQYAPNLEGFAMERFADPSGRGNNTVKYQVGRVLSRHAPTADGLAAAAEELRGLGFDVQQGGRNGDLLEFGPDVVDDAGNPIGTIDVGRGFGAAGSGWAWQPQGGGGGGADGEAPSDIQGAYAYLKSIAHPGMSRAEMESAVARAFGNVPGFEKAYAGDVVINGRKIDLITNFEGANPQWSDNLSFVPLHGGAPAGGGGGTTSGVNLAPGVSLAPVLGNSTVLQDILAEIQRLQRGEAPRAAILDQLGAGA